MVSPLIKRIAKTVLPQNVATAIRDWRIERFKQRSLNMSTEEVFTRIYAEGIWGASRDSETPFYSGSGSHDEPVTNAYVEQISTFLSQFPTKPDIVDLGCGDFSIGARIRPYCANYIACDIVRPLIEFNSKRFADLDVDFRVVNLATDPLPEGDIVFIRQVLQHLSNAEIAAALPRIVERYQYLILTEHIPVNIHFQPNLDKRAGCDVRLDVGSGLVLTEPPFSLKPVESRILCDVQDESGRIQTIAYRLR
jgi:hypothetical protein